MDPKKFMNFLRNSTEDLGYMDGYLCFWIFPRLLLKMTKMKVQTFSNADTNNRTDEFLAMPLFSSMFILFAEEQITNMLETLDAI